MDIRKISSNYAVSPQIEPTDFAAIKAAGFKMVIDNRPDSEIPPTHHASEMQKAAEAEGLSFVAIPVAGRDMTMEAVDAHKAALKNVEGPVLAYCASGTRSTIIWALGQAGEIGPDAILSAAANAGYQIDHLKPTLETLASS